MGHDSIAIGELSRRTGCNIETVRYYERIGLLPKPTRRGTYRRYEAQDVDRLVCRPAGVGAGIGAGGSRVRCGRDGRVPGDRCSLIICRVSMTRH